MKNVVNTSSHQGTFSEEHVRAVNKSVKEAFRLRPSFFAHELLKAKLAKYEAKFGELSIA